MYIASYIYFTVMQTPLFTPLDVSFRAYTWFFKWYFIVLEFMLMFHHCDSLKFFGLESFNNIFDIQKLRQLIVEQLRGWFRGWGGSGITTFSVIYQNKGNLVRFHILIILGSVMSYFLLYWRFHSNQMNHFALNVTQYVAKPPENH